MDHCVMRWGVILFILIASPAMADNELENRDISSGEELYREQCATCHVQNPKGRPNWRVQTDSGVVPAAPNDEMGHTWRHDNQLLFDYTIMGGKDALAARGIPNTDSGMPSFSEELTEAEIWDILAYIQSTWPKRIKKSQTAINPDHQ